MSEESVEHLVRLYLESKNYLVVTGQKFRIEPRVIPEVDIIAINPLSGKRLIGEVKAWKINGHNIRKVWGKDHRDQRHLRFVNDALFRNKLIDKIIEKYGPGQYDINLYVGGLQAKYEDRIKRVIKDEGINLVLMKEVIDRLLNIEQPYSKDPAMQLLVYLKKLKAI